MKKMPSELLRLEHWFQSAVEHAQNVEVEESFPPVLSKEALERLCNSFEKELSKSDRMFETFMSVGKFRLQIAMILELAWSELLTIPISWEECRTAEYLLSEVPRFLFNRWAEHLPFEKLTKLGLEIVLENVMPIAVLAGIKVNDIEAHLRLSKENRSFVYICLPPKNFLEAEQRKVASHVLSAKPPRRGVYIARKGDIFKEISWSILRALKHNYGDCECWARGPGKRSEFCFLIPSGNSVWKRFVIGHERASTCRENKPNGPKSVKAVPLKM